MTVKGMEVFIQRCKTCIPSDNPEQAAELLEYAVQIAEEILLEKSKATENKRANKYGEYGHVKLSKEQYARLIDDFGVKLIEKYITEVDEYCQQSGKKYKDYALTIRNFMRRNGIKKAVKKTEGACPF